MKIDYKKLFLLGFGFMGISVVWALYNADVPVILQSQFGMSNFATGLFRQSQHQNWKTHAFYHNWYAAHGCILCIGSVDTLVIWYINDGAGHFHDYRHRHEHIGCSEQRPCHCTHA